MYRFSAILSIFAFFAIALSGCGVSREAVDNFGDRASDIREALRQVRYSARELRRTTREGGRTLENAREAGKKARMLKKKAPVLELKNGVTDQTVSVKVRPVGSEGDRTSLSMTEVAPFKVPTSRFVDSRTKSFDTEVYREGVYKGALTLEVKRKFFENHQEGENILTLKVVREGGESVFKWTGPAQKAGMAITHLN